MSLSYPRHAFMIQNSRSISPKNGQHGFQGVCFVMELKALCQEDLSPFTETLLIQALMYIQQNASGFSQEPYKAEFSTSMFWASAFLGGCMNVSPIGINWGFAKVLEYFFDINFYQSQCILLPYVMDFFLTGEPQIFINIARAMGVNINDLSKVEAAVKSIEAVRKFFGDLGLPASLSQINVDKNIIPLVADLTFGLPRYTRQAGKDITKEVLEAMLVSAIE